MIRVLHVLGSLNRGGAETMIMNLYRNIDRSKIQFDFVIHTPEECDYVAEILSLGGKVYTLPRYTGKNHFHYRKAWKSFLQQHPQYKIIHGHMRSTASIYLNIAKQRGLFTIAHSHSISSGNGVAAKVKNLIQLPIRYIADYFISCSSDAGEWLFGRKVVQQNNHTVLKNAIEIDSFVYDEETRMRLRSELNVTDKLVIGHVGRFHPSKNHELLIRVFKEIQDANQEVVLILFGRGELEEAVRDQVKKLGIEDRVMFMGVKSDVQDWLQIMDVFVFPSIFEGLGISVIEAQASGLPCVISDRIPKEAIITHTTKAISLDKPAAEWASEVLNSLQANVDRKQGNDAVKEAGYDVKVTAKWTESFYLSC